jgi:hypothetical protein
MSRGARRIGGSRRRLSRASPVRSPMRRPVKTTILIVGEGQQTEPNYFRELKLEDNVTAKFSLTVKKGHGRSPEDVIEEALKYKQQAENRVEYYDEVWCVLDVEGPDKRESLEKAMAVAQQNDITLCLSNPCFEVWLLAHFVRQSRAYNDCDSVIVQLNNYWQSLCGQNYQKNDEHIYSWVSSLTITAIENAKLVREIDHRDIINTADANSSTEVYKLVSYLIDSES